MKTRRPESAWTHRQSRLMRRLRPFGDLTAWVLLLVSLVPLLVLDKPMTVTVVQWTVIVLALAGITVMVVRLLLPHIDLGDWVALARGGSLAAAIVVLAVALLLGLVLLSVVLWAKA